MWWEIKQYLCRRQLNSLPLGILRFDRKQRLAFASKSAFRIWPELHVLSRPTVFRHLMRQMVRHGMAQPSDNYSYARSPDPNASFWDILALNPDNPEQLCMVQVYEDDTPGGITVMLSDMPDLPIDRTLQHAQKMELLGKLAGGVAHDFNNLLSIVDGYTRLLQKQNLPAPAPDFLKNIHNAVQRGTSMTQKLLALGSIKVKADTVMHLSKNLQDMRQLYYPLLGSQIRLAQRIEPDLYVEGPADALTQIMMNLVINARDALQDGGSIMIDARADGDHVILRVTDTGSGMDSITRRRLFEPFYTTKPHGQGTGLGLAVVHGLIQQMNGSIAVESEIGRGTQFTLRFPKAPAQKVSENMPAELVEGHILAGKTILLVEDEPDLLQMLQQTLCDAGATVLAAEHGDAALLAQDDHEGVIDCLLTDVLMPGITGPHLAELMSDLRPDIPVIYMSGYPRLLAGEQRCHVPTDALLLAKPLDPNRLIKVLAATCNAQHSDDDAAKSGTWKIH